MGVCKFLMLLYLATAVHEVDVVARLAPKYNAVAEVKLWDGSRVDLLNEEYAIEADWTHKWAEGVGQCMYYATVTGRKPALMLLVRPGDSYKDIYRAQTVCTRLGIKLYLERVHEE